jgi:hemerythrin
MSLIKWRDSFNTGVKQFDDEHHTLVEMISALFEALRDQSSKEVVVKVCDKLITYTEHHFSNEEKAMLFAEYPKAKEHIAEHDRLKKAVLEFQTTINNEFPKGTSELYRFLREWLVEHIQNMDKQYAPFLQTKS